MLLKITEQVIPISNQCAWTINKPSFLTQTLSKKCSELTKEMVYWQIRQSGRVGLSLILQLLNFQYLWVEQHFMEHRTNPNIIFWTSNKLECAHLLMIEIEHSIFGFQRTNIIRFSLDLSNYTWNWLENHFSVYWMKPFIYLLSNSNTPFLASNDGTSNFEPNRA